MYSAATAVPEETNVMSDAIKPAKASMIGVRFLRMMASTTFLIAWL
jgi:hypothetical protein